jgi:hypothetical protein
VPSTHAKFEEIGSTVKIKGGSVKTVRTHSSVHDRLAECEQRNGGHLEDVIFRVE